MTNPDSKKYLAVLQQITALAQSGLYYSKDVYDQARYHELIQYVEKLLGLSNVITTHFKDDLLNDIGYATPKVDVRAVIFQDQKILMVKESSDGLWSLPGGWADSGLSAAENTVKEVLEETGLTVYCKQLIAFTDMRKHDHPPMFLHVYKAFFLCEIVTGQLQRSIETTDVQFFAEDQLPTLSTARVTQKQIHSFFDYVRMTRREADFD